MSLNKTLDLLTVCAKAGKLVFGFDRSRTAVEERKAHCVLLASDASDKTVKEALYICGKYRVSVFRTDFTADEAYERFLKNYAVFAVCDLGFAKKLSEYSSEIT